MGTSGFLTEDFLLCSEAARELYHGYAASMPIIDYHCHLPPDEIAANRQFEDLAAIWLAGDHYKWRAMRTQGVDERYITGDASPREKFQRWAETVPYTVRNPLYHWTHLELKKPFGIAARLLDRESAQWIWDECNEKLADPRFACRELIRGAHVEVVCTTDDPVDTLASHRVLAADASYPVKVLPAWRPDKAMAVENPAAYNAWVDRLAAAADVDIGDYESFLEALRVRHQYFHERGCRLSDHGVERVDAEEYTDAEIRAIFARVRGGGEVSAREAAQFRSAMLLACGRMDHEMGWVQQYHIGALRNANTRMMKALGPDTGFDCIGDFDVGRSLARFLDRLDATGQLAKTILYNLNPRDNAVFATLIGCFQDGSAPGKMQWGSGWWFLDQKDGMAEQLNVLSNMGLLSRFVGMLTDSRSFLSYSRHEYFRRILCNLVGAEVEAGELPRDIPWLGRIVQDICYHNAKAYFPFCAG
jgi:glucuronate isomerase